MFPGIAILRFFQPKNSSRRWVHPPEIPIEFQVGLAMGESDEALVVRLTKSELFVVENRTPISVEDLLERGQERVDR